MIPRSPRPTPRGRGAADNPHNRFERLVYDEQPDADEAGSDFGDPDAPEDAEPRVPTKLYRDPSRTLLARNESPDIGFDTSLNPYRGCSHGCIYCFARPTHEYLGFSAGLDFETRILVKHEAPALLRKALASPRWQPRVVALGTVTDAYQPDERALRITRGCLEVFAEFRNPVAIVTKSGLVTRDLDLLGELAQVNAVVVFVSVTTLDRTLARRMEPRAATPARRLATIQALSRAGVPTGAMIAPVIPGLNDHEIPALVEAVAGAGAKSARHLFLRLPYGLAPLFEGWLERHYPERKDKVLGRIREVRGGKLNDPRFHHRHRGSGRYADQIHALFRVACRRAGIDERNIELSTSAFRRPAEPQLSLFSS